MSITIKHLDGPLAGKPDQTFDDKIESIVFGRDAKAQVRYPEECIAVDGEHLQFLREADGSYTIELPGSCDVEIDGKPAESGMTVSSGSVITVGVGGPKFEVLFPGVTIKHLEGPLAGQRQYFPYGKKSISFGRSPQKTDVSYPDNCTIVGRLHFSLKGDDDGNYAVSELTSKHYVQISKSAADNGMIVPSSSTFRLGDKTAGPTFSLAVAKPAAEGKVTDFNTYVPPVREEVQTNREEIERVKRLGTYGLIGLAASVFGLGIWGIFRDFTHTQELQQLSTMLTAADDRLTQMAEEQIDVDEQKAVLAAVYLVAEVDGDKRIGKATAWAFDQNKLATNAHVTEEIRNRPSKYVLIGPNGEEIGIKGVDTHPGYTKFKYYLTQVGSKIGNEFKRLDVINHEYDVGIIYPAKSLPTGSDGKTATLDLASPDEVKELKPGASVAAVGFPIEGMTATMVVTDAPATLHFGNISSLTDVFMCRASPDKTLLIQHTVPVTGGMSGSPLVDKTGKVIGVVSGGTIAKVIREVSVAGKNAATGGEAKDKSKIESEGIRIPSAAMVNFAQRVDLLETLKQGLSVAEERVNSDQSYWDEIAAKFDSYFKSVEDAFVLVASDRFDVAGVKSQEVGAGTLRPRNPGRASFDSQTHRWTLQPGHLYGFIAESKSGVPIALNVKKEGTADFLTDEAAPQQALGPVPKTASPAPTALVSVSEPTKVEIEVFSMLDQPAEYEVYVYDWAKPVQSSAADTENRE